MTVISQQNGKIGRAEGWEVETASDRLLELLYENMVACPKKKRSFDPYDKIRHKERLAASRRERGTDRTDAGLDDAAGRKISARIPGNSRRYRLSDSV